MIKLFLLFNLIFISSSANSSCFTHDEYNLIIQSLPTENEEYYDNYPYERINNIVDCRESSKLSDMVCKSPELKKALMLLSIGEIYAYENATHSPVPDYSTYNDNFKFF